MDQTVRRQSLWLALLKSFGFVMLFEGAQLLTAFVVQIVCLLHLSGAAAMEQSDLEEALTGMYYPVLYETMFLAAFLFVLIVGLIYLLRPRTFAEATGLKRTSPQAAAAGVFLGFGAFFLAGLLMNLTTLLPAVNQSAQEYSEQMEEIQTAIDKSGRWWVDVLYTVIGAPVVEEILCRGLILGEIRRSAHPWVAISLSALAFAVIHGNVYQFVFTLPLGLLLGYLAVKFDSIWPTILLHAAFNGSNYLPLIGQYLGYGEEDTVYLFFYYAATGLFITSIPVGILLLRLAARGRPAVNGRVRRDLFAAVQTPMANVIYETEGNDMAAPELLVVGLGNPGEKYVSTRHNAGFIAMDYLAIREGLDFSRLRFRAQTAEKTLDGRKILFMKPQTFMNLSGESVREAAAFYRIPPERILVLVDDVNLAPGVLRIRRDGSAGGHNGLKSIIACLGSEAFPRVRLGVGEVPPERDLVQWVLSALPGPDMDKLVSSLEDVRQTVHAFAEGDLDRAMNDFNGKTR